MLPDPSRERLLADLAQLAVPRDAFENPEHLQAVFHFVRERFLSLDYQPESFSFSYQGRSFNNLVAREPDSQTAGRLLIGAHADAVPGTPGADDNASGLAVLLELARCLADSPLRHHVEWAVFNLEEYGMVGSDAYARHLMKEKIPLAGMLSLEMVGYRTTKPGSQQIPAFLRPFYPSTGDFIALVGDWQSRSLLKQAAKAFRQVPNLKTETLTLPFAGRELPATRLSDHSPFWDAGFPALLVTDTSFFRNPHYHLPSDTIATLDPDFMIQVARGVLTLVSGLFQSS